MLCKPILGIGDVFEVDDDFEMVNLHVEDMKHRYDHCCDSLLDHGLSFLIEKYHSYRTKILMV